MQEGQKREGRGVDGEEGIGVGTSMPKREKIEDASTAMRQGEKGR